MEENLSLLFGCIRLSKLINYFFQQIFYQKALWYPKVILISFNLSIYSLISLRALSICQFFGNVIFFIKFSTQGQFIIISRISHCSICQFINIIFDFS